jgi:hypothetical protein
MDPVDSLKYKVKFNVPVDVNGRLDLKEYQSWAKQITVGVPKLRCRFNGDGCVFATNNENEYNQLLLNGGQPYEGITLQPIDQLKLNNNLNNESSSDSIDRSDDDSIKILTE